MFMIFVAYIYTHGYFRSLFCDISQILIASEIIISTDPLGLLWW